MVFAGLFSALVKQEAAAPLGWNFTQTESPSVTPWYNYGGNCRMSRNGLYCIVSTHLRSDQETSRNAVYEYASGSWSLKGSVISEPSTQYSYTGDCWITNDGTHIAIQYTGSSGNTTGYVLVYEYINGAWTQKGLTVSNGNRFGFYLSLSDDGNTFCCTITGNNRLIYVYDYSNGSWSLRGGSVISTSTVQGTCCMSSDGLRVIGSVRGGAQCKVADWDGSSWSTVGSFTVGTSETSSSVYIGENKAFVTTSPQTTSFTGLVWKYNSATSTWDKSALATPPTNEYTSGICHNYFPPIINATGTKVSYLDKQYEYNSSTNTWDVRHTFPYYIIGYSDTSVALSNTSACSNVQSDGTVQSNDTNFKIDFYNDTSTSASTSTIITNFDVTSVLNAWATSTTTNYFSYTLTGETSYSFANGDYVINVSDYHSSNGIRLNQLLEDGGGNFSGYDWHGDPNTGAYDSNGNPPSTYSSTVDSVTYNGSWIQLSLPYKLEITEVHITGRYLAANTATVDRYPKDALMAGSNDNGATFEFIDDFTTTYTSNSNNRQTVNVTSSKGYYLIRMHVKTTYGAGPMNMEHWSLTGNVVN